MRILFLSLPFAIVATAAFAVQAPVPATPVAAADPLPAGPGRDAMVRVCSGCHAPTIAAGQRMSPAAWKETVETMASRGAMASDAELAEIVDYLSVNFPAPATPPPVQTK